MVLLAAQKRALLARQERLPTFFYIDECQDVIKRDEKLPTILDQARKLNVGMILAHQRLEQMQPHVLSALYGSTAIQFAARVGGNQVGSLARIMKTDVDFITNQPPHSFAAHITDMTSTAVSIKIPFIDFFDLPRLSPDERTAIVEQMRERYAYQPDHTAAPELDTVDPLESNKRDGSDDGSFFIR